MSRRADSDLEREGMLVGAVLNASELARAKRLISALGGTPAMLRDQTARAALTIAVDQISRGELPSAATVFTEGTVGANNLFSAEDREKLRSWQANDDLTDADLITIGRHLQRVAQSQRLGDTFMALGAAMKAGVDRHKKPFGPIEARRWFEQIAQAYNTAHAAGISGDEAVQLTRARHEQELKEGRSAFTKSGIPLFDKTFGGYPKKLVFLIGPGGGGKSTALGTQLDLHQGLDIRSVLSSMEDNHEWPVIRHVALMLGLKYRETYSGPFPDEQKARDAETFLKERWKNLTILSRSNGRTVDEHLALWSQYIVQHGASVFYIDNLTTIDHQLQGRNDTTHAAAARTVEKLAAFADTWHVTVIALAHTKNDWQKTSGGRVPPTLNDVADTGGGIAGERYARLGLGIWSVRKDELRLTCIKNMAEGRLAIERKTLAFDVHSDQGLLDPDSGREVNLQEERRLQAEETKRQAKVKREENFRESKARSAAFAAEERAKKEAAEAADAAAKKPLQHELLHVDPKERR